MNIRALSNKFKISCVGLGTSETANDVKINSTYLFVTISKYTKIPRKNKGKVGSISAKMLVKVCLSSSFACSHQLRL